MRLFFKTLLVVFYPAHLFALSCLLPDAVQGYKSHDLVLIGKINKVTDIGSAPSKNIPAKMGGSDKFSRYNIQVREKFKGNAPDSMKAIMSNYWGDKFAKDQTVLLYMNKTDGHYVIPLCGGSRPIKYAEKDLEILRQLVIDEK